MKVQVHRTYFQMLSPGALRPSELPDASHLRLAGVDRCPPDFYRYLYREVGRQYSWHDRWDWSDEQIIGYFADPAVRLYVLYAHDVPAGYFELRAEPGAVGGRSVEIVYFGLLPHAVGRGLGKHLLTLACREAWAGQPARVWLHTCSLDHPAAVPNYVARGFASYREETYEQEIRERA
jgi:ribosomal protein S18 acetylase RimI-like enzyme